ncbi:MAG: serine O-acetyltransferase [Proteobacteria bacterium]|nr:serine O-acetyltransferase [Pseudomonadota bacterium]MBI3496672.1 serine O-acetyltransferase [Pseudomonadota bacterium]
MIFKKLREDIDSIIVRDPAARTRLEVILCYPGFHAVVLHRLAYGAWARGWRLMAACIAYIGRIISGIEIHPGARIGRRLFIDHGLGVVIGETGEIGDDVTLYQGVTLGGTALHKGKRHPTLEDGVIVGAGAKVLGPITVGAGARVGANAVVLKDVPPGVTMVGIPARQVLPRARDKAPEFVAYGTPTADLPDPVARAIDGLLSEMLQLRARIEELEQGGERRRERAPDRAPEHAPEA